MVLIKNPYYQRDIDIKAFFDEAVNSIDTALKELPQTEFFTTTDINNFLTNEITVDPVLNSAWLKVSDLLDHTKPGFTDEIKNRLEIKWGSV